MNTPNNSPVSWDNHYRASVRYGGSLGWLIFWLIFLFPIAIVMFFSSFSFVNDNREIGVRYSGSRFWLCFWTIFCFPVAIILALLNGFDVRSRPASLMSALILAACFALSGAVSSPAMAFTLEYLGDFNLPQGTQFEGTTIGGLSGLTRDPASGKYLAISDDRSNINPARFYTLDIVLGDDGRPSLSPAAVTSLTTQEGNTFAPRSIDPEGIAMTSDGIVLVSSEGNGSLDPRLPPAVFILNQAGKVTGALSIPDRYIPTPTGELINGVLDNEAFEGLSLSPDGSTLFVMTEGPLVQDDTDADLTKGSINRGMIFKRGSDGSFHFDREFAYAVEPAKHYDDGVTPLGGGNAVSEILALNDHELILLERGGLALPDNGWRSFERVFKVDVSGATDTASLTSLKGQTFTTAAKELLVDLDTLVPALSAGFQSLDNLEGLAFGPMLPDGSRTLLIISDDNFSPAQRTQLLAFRFRD